MDENKSLSETCDFFWNGRVLKMDILGLLHRYLTNATTKLYLEMRVEGEMVRDTAGFEFDNRRSELKMWEDLGIWGDLNDMPAIWKDLNDMRRGTLKKAFCPSYW